MADGLDGRGDDDANAHGLQLAATANGAQDTLADAQRRLWLQSPSAEHAAASAVCKARQNSHYGRRYSTGARRRGTARQATSRRL